MNSEPCRGCSCHRNVTRDEESWDSTLRNLVQSLDEILVRLSVKENSIL